MPRWPDLRAGLIALAIGIALVEGCPIPPPAETLPWQQGVVGVVRPIQRAVMTPFSWIARFVRISQRWALFQAADPERFRLEVIGVAVDGSAELLYRAGDAAHRADADLLEFRRIRGGYNPTDRTPGQYAGFAPWWCDRVLREHPEFVAVHLRMEKLAIAGGVPTGTGVYVFEHRSHR